MKTTFEGTMQPLDTTIPEPALIVLIGAAGSGKSVLASSWPSTQVLELDHFRAMISDCAGDQSASLSAASVMHAVLEARLARKRTTVIDATNTEEHVRAGLLGVARSYGVATVALLVSTPSSVCVARQADRAPARAVPDDVVRRQHAEAVAAFPGLHSEGFDHVVFANNIHRLEPLLQRAIDTRRQELDHRSGSLGDQLLIHSYFGPEVLALWQWRDGSQLADGDRVGDIRLGADQLTITMRTDVDGEGHVDFEVLMPCPVDEDCTAPAWAPVGSASELLTAHTGGWEQHRDTFCTAHGGPRAVDPEDHYRGRGDNPDSRADLDAQLAEAVFE
ncbi:AAA family ATPase [Streptomyces sp. 5.8]|uniref:AAA family ATPase n=1 Tax=Streptomyces sp. 5.8 TaxID=3406571 RepID=UPI003BB66CDE